MIDIENAVISRLFQAFIAAYPNGSYSSEPNTSNPPGWPHLNALQGDQSFFTAKLDSARVMFEINAYSNRTSGAKQECKEIMQLVNDTLMEFGAWEQVFCSQTKNSDLGIYRMTARYKGVAVKESVDGDTMQYRIYRR